MLNMIACQEIYWQKKECGSSALDNYSHLSYILSYEKAFSSRNRAGGQLIEKQKTQNTEKDMKVVGRFIFQQEDP